MIENPAIPYPGAVPHPFTLNDLRVPNTIEKAPSTSALNLSGMGLAVVLAIGAFIWLDPLHLFTPIEASPPASAFVPSAGPARPAERQEVVAPLTPVPATKFEEVPIASALVVRAPQIPAPLVGPRATSIKPESRGNPMDKTNSTVPRASPKEQTAPPAPVAMPEEKRDTPKLGDDTENAPKPSATSDQAPATE